MIKLPCIKELLAPEIIPFHHQTFKDFHEFSHYTDNNSRVKKRRKRTTTHQLVKLQELFDVNPLPSAAERQQLGDLIDMSAREVQVWFQNKRQNQKRKNVYTNYNTNTTYPSSGGSPSSTTSSISSDEDAVAALLGLQNRIL
jgi:hypothetical protein